jgi:hypothetical protein
LDDATMVRDSLAAPATNFGMVVNADATARAGRHRYFPSMEHPTVQLRPVLKLRYSVATAPCESWRRELTASRVAGAITGSTFGGHTPICHVDRFDAGHLGWLAAGQPRDYARAISTVSADSTSADSTFRTADARPHFVFASQQKA